MSDKTGAREVGRWITVLLGAAAITAGAQLAFAWEFGFYRTRFELPKVLAVAGLMTLGNLTWMVAVGVPTRRRNILALVGGILETIGVSVGLYAIVAWPLITVGLAIAAATARGARPLGLFGPIAWVAAYALILRVVTALPWVPDDSFETVLFSFLMIGYLVPLAVLVRIGAGGIARRTDPYNLPDG